MLAEAAYAFRHHFLRDAAYQLHLPSERARLHAAAFELIQNSAGGLPPRLPFSEKPECTVDAHATNAWAGELAEHATRAAESADDPELLLLERLRYLPRAATLAEQTYQREQALRLWMQYIAIANGAEKGEAIRRAAAIAFTGGDARRAETMFKDSVDIQRRCGARMLEGVSLGHLAVLYQNTGRLAQAEQLGEQALAIHRETNNRSFCARAIGNLGAVLYHTGRIERAAECFAEAEAEFRAQGDLKHATLAAANLAILAYESGNSEEGLRRFEAVLAEMIRLDDRRAAGIGLGNLASFYNDLGRYDEAQQIFERAVATNLELGNKNAEAEAHGGLAVCFAQRNRLEQAESEYARALALYREIGEVREEAVVLGNQACTEILRGLPEVALPRLEEALSAHRRFHNPRYAGIHGCLRALCLNLLGRREEAVREWLGAIDALKALKDGASLERQRNFMRQICARHGAPPLE